LDAERDRLTPARPVLASLVAFVSAGLRPRGLLARAIVVVLAAKLIAVVAMMTFSHFADQTAAVDAAAVSRLLGPSSRP
jgi:uncharacterized PurR-regulated membrane protein YhhQ (DUF165 family)